mmetsp:Transcript_17711/g.20160  ORF Transcript_17711/g.20160 Transcript_17711/m.20160 type:complete len:231 (+) Transcript_17711:185-877(+)
MQWDTFVFRIPEQRQRLRKGAFTAKFSISEDRTAQSVRRHNSLLVSSRGQRVEAHKASKLKHPSIHHKLRNGDFSVLGGCWASNHKVPTVTSLTFQVHSDSPKIHRRPADTETPVHTVGNDALHKHATQHSMSGARTCKYNASASLTVQVMTDYGPLFLRVFPRRKKVVNVHFSVLRWLHRHSTGFVDHNDMLVLEQDHVVGHLASLVGKDEVRAAASFWTSFMCFFLDI